MPNLIAASYTVLILFLDLTQAFLYPKGIVLSVYSTITSIILPIST